MNDGPRLTKLQHAVMRLLHKYGDDQVNEGNIIDDLWPLILRPRVVCRGLERKGLVIFGLWSDEVGYDIVLTDAGRAFMDREFAA